MTVNALDPGLVRTKITRNNGLLGLAINFAIGVLGDSASKGAETLVYLATSPEVEKTSGEYFVGRRAVPSSALSYNAGLASDLWELSKRLTVSGITREGSSPSFRPP